MRVIQIMDHVYYSPYFTEASTPQRQLWNSSTQAQYNCYTFTPIGESCKIKQTSSGSTFISGTRGRFYEHHKIVH
jgi:hypothetical protein